MPASQNKTFFLHAIIYGVGDLLTKSAIILLVPFYTEYLSKEELGTIALCQVTTTGAWAILTLGTAQFVQKFFKASDGVDDVPMLSGAQLASTVWWARLILGSLSAFGIWLFFSLTNLLDLDIYLIGLAIATGNFRASLTVSESSLISASKPLIYRLFTFSIFTTSLGMIFVAVASYGLGVKGAVAAECIVFGVWTLVTGAVHTWFSRPAFGKLDWKRTINFSLPIFPHAFFMWGMMNSDRHILKISGVNETDIGIYHNAYLLGSAVAIVGTALTLPWLPTYYKKSNLQESANFFRQRAIVNLVMCFFLTLTTVLFSVEIANLMARKYAIEILPLMQIILIGTFLLTACSLFFKPLVHLKKTAWLSLVSGSSVAFNVALNLFLAPRMGVYGAALATIVSYSIMFLILWYLTNKFTGIQWRFSKPSVFIVPGALAVAMLAAAFLLPQDFGWSIFAIKSVIAILAWGGLAGVWWINRK